MKLLMIYNTRFGYKTAVKTLAEVEEIAEEKEYRDVLAGFIHVEEHDEQDMKRVETKLVKNLKWAAKKNNTRKVIIHSFADLSDSKASPEFTKELFDRVEARMKNAEYEAWQTPFGYFLDLDMAAPGFSSARMFKSF